MENIVISMTKQPPGSPLSANKKLQCMSDLDP